MTTAAPDEDPGPVAAGDARGRADAVVVIGTSAGGLHALETLLAALPHDFRAPILIVQHLAPNHPSLMVEILERHADLVMRAAAHGADLEPGTVTIGVPDHHLVIDDDRRVALTRTAQVRFVRPSIDLLFDSAATVFADRTIGVILTGTGSDGTAGATAIHRAGGTMIVQDPDTAEFDAMPRAVIEAQVADKVLPLDEIAPALLALCTPPETT